MHPQLPQTVLAFFWYFAKEKKQNFALIFFCSSLWAAITTISPYLLKNVIDAIVEFRGDPRDVWKSAAVPVAIYLGLNLLLSFVMRVEEYVTVKTIPIVKARMRETMFDYIQRHSHRYFQDNLTGSLSNKVFDMVRGFEDMFSHVSQTFFPIILNALMTAVLLGSIHWNYTVFVGLWFIGYLMATLYASHQCIIYADDHAQANSTLSGRIVDAFRNATVIKLFAGREHENAILKQYQGKEVELAMRLGTHIARIHLVQGLGGVFLLAFSLWLFLGLWQKGLVTVGDFTMVMSSSVSLMMMTWWMSEHFTHFFKEVGISRQALSIVNVPHEVEDKPGAKDLCVTRGEIVFSNVTFKYRNGKEIFKNKNLTIAAGEKVGIVGYSGAGKTSMIHLILRYFDVESGSILIDGQDIATVTQESLRAQIAVIPQEPSLFHRSLLDNIRYAKPQATEEEVVEASKKARAHDFISELKFGYHATVGEGGVKVSGGQRQRIAIARAILKNSPILILDEATSALDTSTERMIQNSLTSAMEGRTTIVIAHRLSTLASLDRILVFNKGQMAESGTHGELLELNGVYAKLWSMQVDGFLPKK